MHGLINLGTNYTEVIASISGTAYLPIKNN